MQINSLEYYRCQFKAMGTLCEIQLFANSKVKARKIANAAILDVQRLEALYSRYRPHSLLSKINQIAAMGGCITVNEETACLLDYAMTCYEQSDGMFDITSGILRQAWRFDKDMLPEPALIEKILTKVGWHKVTWKRPLLSFSVPGMEIDFGGVVKEYAVDRAAVLCWQSGIRHGLVNLGGDIKVIGPRADGSPWRVGIQHPHQKEAVMQTVSLSEGALASSGDYERCIEVNGVRYGHVLNPKTGWPVKYLAAVSVVGDFCVVAGSASTIAMLKEDSGPEWLASLGLPYLWVDVNHSVGGTLMPNNALL